jgi:hypothetical protein
VALEGLLASFSFGFAVKPRGLRLGPIHDRRAHVGLQGQVDVDHAQLVAVAAGAASLVLARSEVAL